ncbi:hypothetical protein SNEBB_000242, partial [Seison nebaliae]
ILPRTPSFTDYTFTLYHGDLHSGNLIITPNGDPRLIDIGAPIWEGLTDYGRVMLMQYNYYLLKDNIGRRDRERNVVHSKSLINHMQATDLCKVLLFTMGMIMDSAVCDQISDYFLMGKDKLMDIPRSLLQRIFRYYSQCILWSFIPMILRLAQPFREYRDSWWFFYKYFYE